ncbi:hypothetical protein [Corynebacterium sp. CCUG 70398]|uniref:hypothetical protein n=1 Tax=Corynebacterium sp. CCUG 70398 TaxID=2823891 RepID=UPI0021087CE8|nr:hypothetical protein [Corynebacterium sp. CCUG 70398]MCQ4622120.1 hypothetical protein [Corynebacterium sp. CCUG 70398]
MNQPLHKKDEPGACLWCGAPVEQLQGRGRRRKYCSDSCKQRAYERRHYVPGNLGRSGRARPHNDDTLRDRLFALRCAAEDIATAVSEGADTDEIESLCDELVTMAKRIEKLH